MTAGSGSIAEDSRRADIDRHLHASGSCIKARLIVRIDTETGCNIGLRQIVLLEAIQAHGSISGAARALGLSYCGARKMIERVDGVLCHPTVSRLAGGRDGGGALLSSAGKEIVVLYRVVEARTQAVALPQLEELGELVRSEKAIRR